MSRYAIFGTGDVGKALGAKLVSLGHEVMIGSREGAKAADWVESQGDLASQGTFAQAAAFGDIGILCVGGPNAPAVMRAIDGKMDGKVVIDVCNPLDFSQGFPPTLTTCNTTSLGEELQAEFPNVKFVKALNTTNNAIMVNPGALAESDHFLPMCGNDNEAKEKVKELLKSFGWQEIIDLGDMTNARGTEMLLPLWVRLYGKFNFNGMFNFKIVREPTASA